MKYFCWVQHSVGVSLSGVSRDATISVLLWKEVFSIQPGAQRREWVSPFHFSSLKLKAISGARWLSGLWIVWASTEKPHRRHTHTHTHRPVAMSQDTQDTDLKNQIGSSGDYRAEKHSNLHTMNPFRLHLCTVLLWGVKVTRFYTDKMMGAWKHVSPPPTFWTKPVWLSQRVQRMQPLRAGLITSFQPACTFPNW